MTTKDKNAEPRRWLEDGELYVAGDRIVCSNIHCCGSSVMFTARTIHGVAVRPFTNVDAAEYAEFDLDATCECGRYTGVLTGGPRIKPGIRAN